MRDSRQVLTREAGVFVAAMSDAELERWRELWEDAATDFQRACLEAALAAQHSLAEIHAFADAIRGLEDGVLANTVRPPPGDANQDPLRAFQLAGNVLTPRGATPSLPPKPTQPSPTRLMDLTGGAGPARYGNVLDVTDEGGPSGRALFASPQSVPGAEQFGVAGGPFRLAFIGHSLDTGGKALVQALRDVEAALGRGCPVPVILGGAEGAFERYALVLQVFGEGPRKAFQLHDPFADETIWINHRDLEAARELPFNDKSLRRVTGVVLPVFR